MNNTFYTLPKPTKNIVLYIQKYFMYHNIKKYIIYKIVQRCQNTGMNMHIRYLNTRLKKGLKVIPHFIVVK